MSDFDAADDDDLLLDSADGKLLDAAAVTSPADLRRQHAQRDQAESLLQDRRVQAFLAALRQGESGNRANPDGRYNKIVAGGTPDGRFINGGTFDDYSRHPNQWGSRSEIQTDKRPRPYSASHWVVAPLAQRLGLQDFSPHSQDLAAVSELQRLGAIKNLLEGNDLNAAVYSAAKSWESLPAGDNGKSRLGAPRPNALQVFTNRYNSHLY